jgi:hypothetical protein
MKALICALSVVAGSVVAGSVVAGSVVAGSVVAGAPAHADAAEYLRLLDDKYTYLTTQQLLTEGFKVCAAINRGMGASEAVTMVQKDLPIVAVAPATDIVAAASTGLGC